MRYNVHACRNVVGHEKTASWSVKDILLGSILTSIAANGIYNMSRGTDKNVDKIMVRPADPVNPYPINGAPAVYPATPIDSSGLHMVSQPVYY